MLRNLLSHGWHSAFHAIAFVFLVVVLGFHCFVYSQSVASMPFLIAIVFHFVMCTDRAADDAWEFVRVMCV